MPLLLSALLFVFGRWEWSGAKLFDYVTAIRLLRYEWCIRCCVRFWGFANWDFGLESLHVLKNDWAVIVQAIGAGDTTVISVVSDERGASRLELEAGPSTLAC